MPIPLPAGKVIGRLLLRCAGPPGALAEVGQQIGGVAPDGFSQGFGHSPPTQRPPRGHGAGAEV
ncbi:hypothetical protein GCM10010219_14360 [Streptomyces netropsis]|nr:hypothetical protein GCM10010219_14360 [Streptomyces netropsis]